VVLSSALRKLLLRKLLLSAFLLGLSLPDVPYNGKRSGISSQRRFGIDVHQVQHSYKVERNCIVANIVKHSHAHIKQQRHIPQQFNACHLHALGIDNNDNQQPFRHHLTGCNSFAFEQRHFGKQQRHHFAYFFVDAIKRLRNAAHQSERNEQQQFKCQQFGQQPFVEQLYRSQHLIAQFDHKQFDQYACPQFKQQQYLQRTFIVVIPFFEQL